MSSIGKPSDPKMMSIVTREALGTLATPMLVAVEAKLERKNLKKFNL